MSDPVDTRYDLDWLSCQVAKLFESARDQKEKDHKTLLEYAKLLRELLTNEAVRQARADNGADNKLSVADGKPSGADDSDPVRLAVIRAGVQEDLRERRERKTVPG